MQIVPVSQSFLVISFAVCNLNEITQDVLALWFDDGRLSSIDE